MTEATYEHHFVTLDKDGAGNTVTFKMIEDERGDIFWAYHHVPPRDFINEVNRYLANVDETIEPIEPMVDGPAVKHLWARMTDEERFEVVAWADDPEIFPVTRLMV